MRGWRDIPLVAARPKRPRGVARRSIVPRLFASRDAKGALRRRDEAGAGVALILVLSVIAILTTAVVDFTYTTRVHVEMSASARDGLRARYLATSALNFARVILHYQRDIDGFRNRPEFKNSSLAQSIGAQLQLWRISMLLDCATINMVAGDGLLAGGDDDDDRFNEEGEEEAEAARARQAGRSAGEGDSPGNVVEGGEGLGESDQVAGIGPLPGDCRIEVDNENRKIQLWRLRGGAAGAADAGRNLVIAQLRQLLMPSKYDRLFQDRDPDGQYTTRDELIGALVDWIDDGVGQEGLFNPVALQNAPGSEDSYYQGLKDRYLPKNGPFDSMGELELVRGVGDWFLREFGGQITIYPGPSDQGIYVGDANPWLIRATLCSFFVNPQDPNRFNALSTIGCPEVDPQGTRFQQFWAEFQTWWQQKQMANPGGGLSMLMGSAIYSWADYSEFLAARGVAVSTLAGAKPEQIFGDRVTTFKVKAHGYVGDARRTITAVVNNEVAGTQMWYYRED